MNYEKYGNFKQIQENINQIELTKEKGTNQNTIKNNKIDFYTKQNIEKKETRKEEYQTMPKEQKGYKVVGKIAIPKLKLDTYILGETTTKSLKVSVTKLYGPEINQIGNFCMAGHNYRNNKMFGGIKKLEIGDKIILTDTYGDNIIYEVYKNYQTDPKDVTSLSQDTGEEKEITLITCTAGAIKRVIVKAVEVYD